ncbi:hypothetical protein Pvag_pPag20051 (plasmid) [Pantoea vagans C9-1]|nr:hypothetical protein Pvag_pPag20051 [Pantoea vagans C9-1]
MSHRQTLMRGLQYRTVQMPEKRWMPFPPVYVVAGEKDLMFRGRCLLGAFISSGISPPPGLMVPTGVVHNLSTVFVDNVMGVSEFNGSLCYISPPSSGQVITCVLPAGKMDSG